mmetsp:Transcript_7774/g.17056  ORF Transcript_7774/g.17056 Transcript_7774/m.17056 type:complete len:218 (-) Transcript_7774:83-736(-)
MCSFCRTSHVSWGLFSWISAKPEGLPCGLMMRLTGWPGASALAAPASAMKLYTSSSDTPNGRPRSRIVVEFAWEWLLPMLLIAFMLLWCVLYECIPALPRPLWPDMPKLGAKSRSNRSRPSPDCVESASSESPPPVEVEWQDSSKSSLGLRLAAVGVGSHDLDRTRVMPGVASSNSRNPFLMMHPCGTPIIPPGLSESRCQATDPKGNTKLNAMCSL